MYCCTNSRSPQWSGLSQFNGRCGGCDPAYVDYERVCERSSVTKSADSPTRALTALGAQQGDVVSPGLLHEAF